MADSDMLADLDPQQRAAVLAPRGPVCVLAGAGTGKTRTITRRIAHLIDSGQVNPSQVLAVTFTARAAGEMRTRLRSLGIAGAGNAVQAQTFHAAAMRQLRYFWPQAFGDRRWQLLDRKIPVLAGAARRAGVATGNDMLRDLASEIEWAKASLLGPGDYAEAAIRFDRDAPVEPRKVADVWSNYERLKQADPDEWYLDFDDLLIYTAQILRDVPGVAEEFRSRYRCFVVDEYQDVTPVQQGLLDMWLGERDDLTVVGDANQTIYTFTGATPKYLLDFSRRFEHAEVVRLERDYRSTPEVVDLANRVIGAARGRIAGTRLRLIGQRDSGPEPTFTEYDDEPSEAVGAIAEIKSLIRRGVAPAEIAILYRVNAQSENFEQALTEAGIPYQVRGGDAFFQRTEIRQALRQLDVAARQVDPAAPGPSGDELKEVVAAVLTPLGLTEEQPSGAEARARWESLRALSVLTDDMVTESPNLILGQLISELSARAQARHPPTVQGVTLSSLHAAKGLEWDAVFLVGVTDGSLPISQAINGSAEDIEEERRLLYVGVTRAREHLNLSWALSRNEGGRRGRRRSRFLNGIAPEDERPAAARATSDKAARKQARVQALAELSPADTELFDALKAWRLDQAREQAKPPFVVFSDRTLIAMATARPSTIAELGKISGVGSSKLESYGADVVEIVKAASGD
ncbi:ATP-dependent DNA helicase UvrD2 [Gordonia effusa NBRC 100432]|uniref:DNA 3'-5' helicase n=2 Tax=Gordonia effusa TaxID=263908 RepID=H0QUG3_9ACTN|nr:ATP-dependent DNA helicase UvrD2 [Gordonia effusa NBRC 100432]